MEQKGWLERRTPPLADRPHGLELAVGERSRISQDAADDRTLAVIDVAGDDDMDSFGGRRRLARRRPRVTNGRPGCRPHGIATSSLGPDNSRSGGFGICRTGRSSARGCSAQTPALVTSLPIGVWTFAACLSRK